MFYRESYNNLWYEKNPQIIEIFDHLLGTLVGDIVNRITVSFIFIGREDPVVAMLRLG